ncbi:MAG: flagellar basal-body rod protein FlgG, partial [Myxococcota bacterium]
ANNIANVNTTGFKGSRAEFQELIYQQVRAAGNPNVPGGAPTNVEVGLGVRTAATQKDFAQGTLEATENPLDVAIEGTGFFQVQQLTGEFSYTRAGNFKLDANGMLVTADGLPLDPPVTVPPEATSVAIERDGRVNITLPGDNTVQEVGQIQLVNFPNPAGLQSLGRGQFAPTDASGPPVLAVPGELGMGELSQGFLEGSNVEIVQEMVSMIVSQRAYEINSKVIRTADEMLRTATNVR